MPSDDDARHVEERCRLLSTAMAVGQTISLQETVRAPDGPALDDPPASLPHLSLVPEPHDATPSTGAALRHADASGAARWPTTNEPDLQVIGVIGEGGMGRVVVARQRSLRRDVAVKTLRPDAATRATTLALLREGVITGALEHPNIVPIHAIGCDDRGRPLMVMKRVEGVAWSTLLDDVAHPAWKTLDLGREDPLEAHLEILASVCNALHFAHRRGVVHRDVKPENVMVGALGEVYLVDWGVAARAGTTTKDVIGTPCYLAPEMVRGLPIDARTDVYLLGATLHRVLTGAPRHDAPTLQATLLSAAYSEPFSYDAAIADELATLCNAATHVDPRARPESALAFRRALEDHLRHRGAIALCAAADRLLVEASALRRAPNADATRVLRLLTEARFGFRQSLAEWSEGAAARRGLGACLEEMIDLELAQGDDAGARALLHELPDPRPHLEARIAEHEATARARKEHDEELRALERDMDPRVARRSRFLAIIVGSLAIFALSTWVTLAHHGSLTTAESLRFAVGLTVLVLGTLLVFRRRVLRNAYNRRLFSLLGLACLAIVAGRAAGVVQGTSLDETFTHDMISFAVIAGVGAITVVRWLVWPALFYAVSAVLSALVPGIAPMLFNVFALASVVAGAVVSFRKLPSIDDESP